MEDLQRVYNRLCDEMKKVQNRIDRIDKIFPECDRLNREYMFDSRIEAVEFLNGLSKAADIIWKELHK